VQVVNQSKTTFSERFIHDLFNSLNVPTKLNNVDKLTDVDLLISDLSQADVQYSEDFQRWGDLRVDFISADQPQPFARRSEQPIKTVEQLYEAYEAKHSRKVIKRGKHFLPNYLDDLIVLFYNNKLPIKLYNAHLSPLEQVNLFPDHLLIVHSKDLINYIENNLQKSFAMIRRNNKSDLSDNFGSAFIPISVKELIKETNCLWFENFTLNDPQLQEINNYFLK